MRPSTFSIVAFDERNGDLGIAVASKFLAVGAVVPWAEAGVGAIATQSLANTRYGPEGLRLLAAGHTAQEALVTLVGSDPDRDERQVGIVDARGRAATYTGHKCHAWAGGVTGLGYAIQGNILVGAQVVSTMEAVYRETSGSLAERLLAALTAGQAAGGDSRGQQSAALLVVRTGGGYGGFNDRYIDLRVDDHPTPVDELRRLLHIHHLYFEKPKREDILSLDRSLIQELQQILIHTGFLRSDQVNSVYDQPTREALRALFGRENLEERWCEGDTIDRVALSYLRERFSS
jgi:uncharacterized Ntn-hydrolase superfamily protein